MIKKLITGIAVAGLLLAPAAAFARSINVTGGSLDCDTGILTDSLGATSTMSTALCNGGGGPIVGTIPMSWGLLDGQTPIAPEGSVIVDQYGFSVPCLYTVGCYDLTRTAWYVSYMLNVGRQLKAFGVTGGPFAGWINAAQ